MCAKVYRSMTSGCRGAPRFKRYDGELVLKTAISLRKPWGGLPKNDSQSMRANYKTRS